VHTDVKVHDSPELSVAKRHIEQRPLSAGAKRLLDLAVLVVSLPLVLPLMAVIAVLVKLTSRGPVLFLHERVGRGGEIFRLVKFRSMYPGTHESIWSDIDKVDRFAEMGFKLDAADPAITALGRFLRRTSLDELPQLFNVLNGSMSLVGVRPLVVPELSVRSPHDQELYKSMRPGITGRWQTEGRSTVDPVNRCRLDREYVEQWSLMEDVRILLRTPIAVFKVHHAA